MGQFYYDALGEEVDRRDPNACWCVVWVETSTGFHAHVGEVGVGKEQHQTLVFEGWEFTPHDALLAFEAHRRQVSTYR